MNVSASILIKALIGASLFAAVAAAGSVTVQAQRGGGLNSCPSGWHLVTPPLNPVLLCLPDTLVFDLDEDEAPPSGTCPEGWMRVTPPLNPVLGCLPATVVRPTAPRAPARGNDGTCPEGFRPATSPLSAVLGCLPDNFFVPPNDSDAGPIPPGSCPDGWRPATPPLNPLLICLPNNLRQAVPGGSDGQ